MTIVLTYTTENGNKKQAVIEKDTPQIIRAPNEMTTIDLAPLASCTNLQRILLGCSLLQSIDLPPLANCTDLIELTLRYNKLRSIDIIPLSSCVRLHSL